MHGKPDIGNRPGDRLFLRVTGTSTRPRNQSKNDCSKSQGMDLQKHTIPEKGGSNMATVKAYRCNRTGLMFPADYVEQWGIKYGIGLGCKPVSEALVNDYKAKKTGEGESEMYPVATSCAEVTEVEVDEDVYNAKRAILNYEDPNLNARAIIMRLRQISHGKIIVKE
jgi:hypothetical protein